jgi:hypothetical protein
MLCCGFHFQFFDLALHRQFFQHSHSRLSAHLHRYPLFNLVLLCWSYFIRFYCRRSHRNKFHFLHSVFLCFLHSNKFLTSAVRYYLTIKSAKNIQPSKSKVSRICFFFVVLDMMAAMAWLAINLVLQTPSSATVQICTYRYEKTTIYFLVANVNVLFLKIRANE